MLTLTRSAPKYTMKTDDIITAAVDGEHITAKITGRCEDPFTGAPAVIALVLSKGGYVGTRLILLSDIVS
jgi:hypothetical protein